MVSCVHQLPYYISLFLFQSLSAWKLDFCLCITWCSFLASRGSLLTWLCGSLSLAKVRMCNNVLNYPLFFPKIKLKLRFHHLKTLNFRFPLWHISHHIGRYVLLPDSGNSRGPQCCFWCSQDRRFSNSYTGMSDTHVPFWIMSCVCKHRCQLTLNASIFSFTRWLEETSSSSSFSEAWRKCITSLWCSLFSICGAPLRYLGKHKRKHNIT